MKEIIKEIGSVRIEKMIAVSLVKGDGTPETPTDLTTKYYTEDGVYIGELHNPPTMSERARCK